LTLRSGAESGVSHLAANRSFVRGEAADGATAGLRPARWSGIWRREICRKRCHHRSRDADKLGDVIRPAESRLAVKSSRPSWRPCSTVQWSS
jgi:hypothetical protein